MVSPKCRQIIFASSSLLCMVSIGMMFGYPMILIPALLNKNSGDLTTSSEVTSWIASIPGLSGLITVVSLSPLMHHYGRRITHILVTSLLIVGWALMPLATNITTLFIGRAIQGLAYGSIYFYSICISEVTEPAIRGIMLNLKLLTCCIGTFIIHFVGAYLHWRQLAILPIIPYTLSILITIKTPDSPEWLISRQRYDEARSVFFYLRKHSDKSERELNSMITHYVELAEKNQNGGLIRKIRSKVLWRPAILLICVIAIPEIAGRHYYMSYAMDFLQKVIGTERKPHIYVYILDFITIIGAFFTNFIAFKYKRRTILLASTATLTILLYLFSLTTFLKANYYNNPTFVWLSFIVLALQFLVAYSCTFSIVYTLMGELIPMEYRSIGTFIDGFVTSIMYTIALKLIPWITEVFQIHGTFLVLGIAMTFNLAYIYFMLPETKNRTLHDIGEYFRGRSTKYYNGEKHCEEHESVLGK